MSADPDAFHRELALLRRQVRTLQLLFAFALVLAAVSLWLSLRHAAPGQPADAEPEVLVGRSLYLREDPDQPYVRLKYLHGGAGLLLGDVEGRGQVQLVASPGRGKLLLGSAPARVDLDAERDTASLTLRDRQGKPRIVLTAGETPRIAVLDGRGKVVFAAPGP